ncbi:MAG: RepB family plasmid replication initiator protein, partial [Desulfamplus sp.]|nr:RepB family plasmid replication initiator protein [Desulfamplus sp.]
MNKKDVIKHSAAIQISNKVSVLQRRAWNVLLANAFDELEKKDTYQLSIKELAGVLGFDSGNLQYLKELLKELNVIQVEWNILRKDYREWGVFTLLSQALII